MLVNTKFTNLTACKDGKCTTINNLVHYVQSFREEPVNVRNLPKIGEIPKEWKSFDLASNMRVYILTYVGYSRFVESVIVKVCQNHCIIKDFGEVTLKCIYPFNFHLFERNCKRAIEMWLRARLFYKDLRQLIAGYIWRTREDILWGILEENSPQNKKRKIKL